MLHENTDVHGRTWPHLTDNATGRTLHLAPGERADIDVAEDFTDPFLKARKPSARKPHAPEPEE